MRDITILYTFIPPNKCSKILDGLICSIHAVTSDFAHLCHFLFFPPRQPCGQTTMHPILWCCLVLCWRLRAADFLGTSLCTDMQKPEVPNGNPQKGGWLLDMQIVIARGSHSQAALEGAKQSCLGGGEYASAETNICRKLFR